MRKAIAILIAVGCGVASADARGRHHHGHHAQYWRILPSDDTGRERSSAAAPAERLPEQKSIDESQIVPRDWKLQPPDPSRNGQRFVSPDGAAWFEWYRVAATDKSVAAYMKSVAFGEGEEITQVRGERSWIAVSGFRADRIFYREALLACAGDRWHHIAFEYPSSAKGSMADFVRRAAAAVEATQNSGCDIPVSSPE